MTQLPRAIPLLSRGHCLGIINSGRGLPYQPILSYLTMLRRTQSTFIAPGGMQHSFSVVNTSPRVTPSPATLGLPSQVTVTYGKQTKAFGRQRLQQFNYYVRAFPG